MGQIYRLVQIYLGGQYDKDLAYEIFRTANIYNESFSMRFFVHDSLFRNVVNMLGNKEQADRYNDDIDNFRILGCFAMVSRLSDQFSYLTHVSPWIDWTGS